MSEPDEAMVEAVAQYGEVWLAVEGAMLAIEGEVTYQSLTDAALSVPVVRDALASAAQARKAAALQSRVADWHAQRLDEPTHNHLNVERCPQTLGDAMRLIGRYTESEGGQSAETMQARADLFDAYETWCHLDRPETEATALTGDQRERFEAAATRALAERHQASGEQK